jgi:hypothetical protein
MADQNINFENGSVSTGDSGEREETTAIKPIVAGERVRSSVVNRPFENLRSIYKTPTCGGLLQVVTRRVWRQDTLCPLFHGTLRQERLPWTVR